MQVNESKLLKESDGMAQNDYIEILKPFDGPDIKYTTEDPIDKDDYDFDGIERIATIKNDDYKYQAFVDEIKNDPDYILNEIGNFEKSTSYGWIEISFDDNEDPKEISITVIEELDPYEADDYAEEEGLAAPRTEEITPDIDPEDNEDSYTKDISDYSNVTIGNFFDDLVLFSDRPIRCEETYFDEDDNTLTFAVYDTRKDETKGEYLGEWDINLADVEDQSYIDDIVAEIDAVKIEDSNESIDPKKRESRLDDYEPDYSDTDYYNDSYKDNDKYSLDRNGRLNSDQYKYENSEPETNEAQVVSKVLDALKAEFGDLENTKGCYINNKQFTPARVAEIIKSVNNN